ncbi:hypothetical protein Bp8pS_107 [Bacillus phage vB_BpuM-BpSp]|nr:hypothetical protein Bp8pS_107 [Bacillus phage vB_BpuM-BpSp]
MTGEFEFNGLNFDSISLYISEENSVLEYKYSEDTSKIPFTEDIRDILVNYFKDTEGNDSLDKIRRIMSTRNLSKSLNKFLKSKELEFLEIGIEYIYFNRVDLNIKGNKLGLDMIIIYKENGKYKEFIEKEKIKNDLKKI